MGVFDLEIKTARTLISKNGQTVTYRNFTGSSYIDADQPFLGFTEETFQDHSVKIVFLPMKRIGFETKRSRAETEISTVSYRALMAVSDFEPSAKDVVIRDGVELQVLNVQKLQPNDEKILFKFELKA